MNPLGRSARAASLVRPRRHHALDLLRTLAIIGMMAAHTARLITPEARPDWARFVLLIEPLIPSLFLFLVGLSLVHSFDNARRRGQAPGAWYARQVTRAGGLWLVSALFFALELGVRLPDVVLAGGILATIAYAIVLVGALLALPAAGGRGRMAAGSALAGVLCAGSALFVWLDVRGLRVHPVNVGNSPFLPLWLFTLAGALWGTLVLNEREPAGPQRARPAPATILAVVAGLAAGGVAVALIAHYGLDTLFTKPFGRSDASRLVPAPVYGGAPLNVGYYNLKPWLALACLGLHLVALMAFDTLQAGARHRPGAQRAGAPRASKASKASRVPVLRIAGTVLALGRYALTAYILHLALLATLVVLTGDRQPLRSGWQGTGVLVALIFVCHAVAILRVQNKNLRFRH